MRKANAKTRRAGSGGLPVKFTDDERRAYDWLHDCNISPWVVDLLTKRVKTARGEFDSLVAYAIQKGWQQ
jgi:hypothetical protein